MSIVEKALRKIQAGRLRERERDASPRYAVGSLVESVHAVPPVPLPFTRIPETRPPRIIHIDLAALRSAGLLPPESQERELGNQYRAIKRPLIRNAFEVSDVSGRPRHLVMLTSALPGEGKTFTCINLSLSLSLETDLSVLLVDCDAAKPHVSRMFGIDKEPGILDVLADPTRSIESVILPTSVPRLSILPAGQRSEVAAELLASSRMRDVMQRLAATYAHGIVVFDSSPILLTTEARALASLVGQVILVVKAGETPQQALKDTIELLGTASGVSLVLNNAELSGPMGYYYGHSYGYGSSPPES